MESTHLIKTLHFKNPELLAFSNCEVFKAEDTKTGKIVILKSIKRDQTVRRNKKYKIPFEVFILKKVQHISGVVKLLDYHKHPKEYLYVFEYIPETVDLWSYLNEKRKVQEDVAWRIMKRFLLIMKKVEDLGCFHLDIKEENILISTITNEITIIDFGSSRYLKDSTKPISDTLTTFICRPPESFSKDNYLVKPFMVWQYGLIWYRLVHTNTAFMDRFEIMYQDVKIDNTLTHETKHMIRLCLNKDPTLRPTLSELIEFLN